MSALQRSPFPDAQASPVRGTEQTPAWQARVQQSFGEVHGSPSLPEMHRPLRHLPRQQSLDAVHCHSSELQAQVPAVH
jgi:hypothetical protein